MPGPSSPLFVSVRLAHRKPRWRRVARTVVVVVAALVVVALVTIGALWRYAEGHLRTTEVATLEHPADASPPPLEGARNVLVVATANGGRADTIVLVHASPPQPRTLVVALPPDLKVNVAGAGIGRLGAALDDGGPDLLVRTVEEYTSIQIDHYVEVDVVAAAELADALGSLRVCPEGIDCRSLDGDQARDYAVAFDLPTTIQRRTELLFAAADRVATAGTVLNPFRLKRLIDVVSESVITDDAVGTRTVIRLATRLRDGQAEDVRTVTLPGEARRQGGVEYFVAEPEGAETIFQAIRDGDLIAPTPTPPPSPPAPLPQDVRVRVLNGAGVADLATRVSAQLAEAGFQLVEVGNAESYDVAVTELRYAAGHEADAGLLATYFPGATSVESDAVPDDTDVVVVLGRDQAGRA